MAKSDREYPLKSVFKEYCLIFALRHMFKGVEVVILMRDHRIQYIKQAWISDALEKPIMKKLDKK